MMRWNVRRNVVNVSNGIANLQNDMMEDKSANSRQHFSSLLQWRDTLGTAVKYRVYKMLEILH